MYQKFITKKGKKIGPYFYESIRLQDGKVKTVYLGSNEQVALQKLQALRKEHGLPEQQIAQKTTPSQALPQQSQPLPREAILYQRIRDHEQRKQELLAQYKLLQIQYKKKIISLELFEQKYSALFGDQGHIRTFINHDSEISVLEQEILRIRQDTTLQSTPKDQSISSPQVSLLPVLLTILFIFAGFYFFQPSLTGFAFLSPENITTATAVESLDIITNTTTTYILNFTPTTSLQSLKVSGSYEAGGSVRIYLVNDNYLIYDSERQTISRLTRLREALSSFLSGITGGAVLQLTNESFFVMDETWTEIKIHGARNEENLTIFLDEILPVSFFFSNVQGNSFMFTNNSHVLVSPEELFFITFYAINSTDLNFTEASFTKVAQGIQLYRCSFWDFESGLCLGSWEEVLNLTPGTNYTVPISQGLIAFAEASLTPLEEELPLTINESSLEELNQSESSSIDNQIYFSQQCVDTCELVNFSEPQYKLVIVVQNTTVNISSVEYTFISSEQQQEQLISPLENVSQQLQQKQKKDRSANITITPYTHKIHQKEFNLSKNTITGDNWERSCQGNSCKQIIYRESKFFVKEDDTVELIENALEATCDGKGALCARGNDYRADFKNTPAEKETISFTKENNTISFQPLRIRYVDDVQETVLSHANPVYGYGENNIYTYQDIFGLGTAIRLTYEPKRLKEEIIFADNFLLLDNNILGTTGYIFIDYLFLTSENISLFSEQGELDLGLNQTSFFNTSTITSNNETLALLPQPYAYSNTSFDLIDYALTRTNEGLRLSLRIPTILFSQATYPLIIDPTIILTSANILADGYVQYDVVNDCWISDFVTSPMEIGYSNIIASCGGGTATINRGDIEWDFTSIPKNADIIDINLTLYVATVAITERHFEFNHIQLNSTNYAGNDQGLYDEIGDGTQYLDQRVDTGGYNMFNLTNSTQLPPDIETILWQQQRWWGIGITSEETTPNKNYQVETSETGVPAQAPTLMIQYELPPPWIDLNGPVNQTTIYDITEAVLNATIYDNEPQIEEVVFFASNKTLPDGDDIVYIARNVTNSSEVAFTFQRPVWESDANTVLNLHFNNRSLYGENDTYVIDYSNESNNGSVTYVVSNPIFVNFTTDCAIGYCLDRPNTIDEVGTNANVTLGDQDELIGSDYTWMLWLTPATTSSFGIFFTKFNASTLTGLEMVRNTTSLVIKVDTKEIPLSNFFVANQPVHLAVTLDSSGVLRTYKNGMLVNDTTGITTITPNAIPLDLFVTQDDGKYVGTLDEVVILNRTLQDMEVFSAFQTPPDTYYWYVNATDYSGEPLGVNMSDLRMFTFISLPYAILSTPPNLSNITPSGMDIILNTTVYSDLNYTLTVKIFGENSTTTPSTEALLYMAENVANGTEIKYNWTSPLAFKDDSTKLILHFDNRSEFYENDTVFYDFSGQSNNATCNGSICNVTFNETSGKFAGAFEFPGETFGGSMPLIPYQYYFSELPLTVETWVKFSGLSTENGNNGSSVEVIAQQSHAITPFNSWTLSMRNNDDIFFSVANSSGSNNFGLAYTPAIAKDTWYHFVGTGESNGTFSLYVNGVKVSTVIQSDLFNATGQFKIGGGSSTSQPLNGTLDEFVFYNRALSYAEVTARYKLGRGKYFWQVNVSDGFNENQSETWEFRLNALPTIVDGPTLLPLNMNTSETYICNFTITDDDDSDGISYDLEFFNFTDTLDILQDSATNGTAMEIPVSFGDVQGKNDQNTCRVTPFNSLDGIFVYGTAATSNTVTVLNSPPNPVSLIAPEHLNQTFNRTSSFDYNTTTDPDGDELNYTLNLTCLSIAGGSCSGAGDNRLLNFTSNVSGLTPELLFFIDDGYFYNWTVLAFDGENESDWTNPPRSVNISALVDIALLINNIDFGGMGIGATTDTDSFDIEAFTLRNNGNVEIEVNLSENSTSSLFTSQTAPSIYYQFKGDNDTIELGAFSWSDSITTWTNVPRTPTNLTVFKKFNHTDSIDEAQIDINISIPLDEPAGYKESTLEFIGYYVSAA